MSASTFSNLSNILKKMFEEQFETLFFSNHPFLAMVEKDTSWSGDVRAVQVQYGVGNGRAGSFAAAKAAKGPSKFGRMNVETADNFITWSVDHKLIMASRNDKGAIRRALQGAGEDAIKKFRRSVAWQLWSSGSGSVARLSASQTLSATTFIPRTTRDARKIEVGDLLAFSATDGSGTVKDGTVQVTAVNREDGTITVDQALNAGCPTVAVSDYVFISGDYGVAIKGVPAYVTESSTPGTIWGMARTDDVVRLTGIRVGGKGLLIEEAIRRALTKAYDEEAEIDKIFINPEDFEKLELSLGSGRRYADEKVGKVGFTGIEFVGGGSSPVKCFQDPDVPKNVIYGLNMKTWKFASMGEYPMWLNLNGNTYEQEESSNSFEGRMGGYGQLYTTAPGQNFRLDLTVAAT